MPSAGRRQATGSENKGDEVREVIGDSCSTFQREEQQWYYS